MAKLKLGVYWAASCGGCDIAIVELGEHLLELAELADIVFWPCAMDFKYRDVEAMPDGFIDLTLFNGAIRTEEDAHIAHLLRSKSKALVAFGSCAIEGCIPGLSNIKGPDYALYRASQETPTTDNPKHILPQRTFEMPEGTLTLPGLLSQVCTLEHVVPVDYSIPGCPPNHDQVWNAITAVVENRLPPAGSLLGVDSRTVCDQCPRVRQGKIRVDHFSRPHEVIPDPERCFLEQGLICAGPATHAGCGALCIKANMPCRGCYGPPDGVVDQGAALLDAVVAGFEGKSDAEIRKVLATIVDPVGTFYRFSLGGSFLHQLKVDPDASGQVCAAQSDGSGGATAGETHRAKES
ncbi:MAG: oxidoreductase [Anaerolineae bacterium]|nr:oxidoreductase [Anaerolineae bacterium]